MIKAIETRYNGYRFRSRLEARWAVFFDALGVKWEYEKEGYDLGEWGWYLPDFWLPEPHECFVEIKAHRNLSAREIAMATGLSDLYPTVVMCGVPETPSYHGPCDFLTFDCSNTRDEWYRGSFGRSFPKFLGPVPSVVDARYYCWHERTDGSLILWPAPAFELHPVKKHFDTPRLRNAYEQARAARFEHGERPSP